MGVDRLKVPISLSVIIPVYNEAERLDLVMEEFHEEIAFRVDRCEFILIDDGSTDDTSGIAGRLADRYGDIVTVRHPENQGFGSAMRRGLELARYEYVTFLTSNRRWIGWEFFTCLRHVGKADIILPVIRRENRAWHRKMLSLAYTRLLNLLFGHPLQIHNTAYILKTELARTVQIEFKGYAAQAEFLFKLLDKGHSYHEVPGLALRHIVKRDNPAMWVSSFVDVGRSLFRLYVMLRWKSARRGGQRGVAPAVSTPVHPGR